MLLGDLVTELSKITVLDTEERPMYVRYDFADTHPTQFASWRGVYSEIALGYEGGYDHQVRVSELFLRASEALGAAFDGYKGGHFVMMSFTPVWVANWGRVGTTRLVRVEHDGHEAILITQHNPF